MNRREFFKVAAAVSVVGVAPAAKAVAPEEKIAWMTTRYLPVEEISYDNLDSTALSYTLTPVGVELRLDNDASVSCVVRIAMTPVSPLRPVKELRIKLAPREKKTEVIRGRWSSVAVVGHTYNDIRVEDTEG